MSETIKLLMQYVEKINSKSQELADQSATIQEVLRDDSPKNSADLFSEHYTDDDIAKDKNYLNKLLSDVRKIRNDTTKLEQLLEKKLDELG